MQQSLKVRYMEDAVSLDPLGSDSNYQLRPHSELFQIRRGGMMLILGRHFVAPYYFIAVRHIQAWIFEAIGLVVSEYAIKGNHGYPRIKRWTVRGAPTDSSVISLLSRPDDELHTKQVLKPTKQEKTSQYYISVRRECRYLPVWVDEFEQADWGPTETPRADEKHSPARRMKAEAAADYTADEKQSPARRMKVEDAVDYTTDPTCDSETRTKCQMDYVMQRFDNLDMKVQSIDTEVDEFKKVVLNKMEADMEEQRRFMEKIQSFMDMYNATFRDHFDTDPLNEGISGTTPVMGDEDVAVARPEETTHTEESVRILTHKPKGCSQFGRQYQRSTSVRSPFIVPQPKRPRVVSNIDTVVADKTEVAIDPFKGIDDPQLLIELNQWMAGVIDVTRLMKFMPSFYNILLGNEEDDWLNYEHINEYLILLSRRQQRFPDAHKEGITHTDTWFFGFLKSVWDNASGDLDKIEFHEALLNYYHGAGISHTLSKPWKEVDIVLIPINLNNAHWILAHVNLKKRQIRTIDSYVALYEDRDLIMKLAPFQHVVPRWLDFVGIYNDRPELKNDAPWRFMRSVGTPQQEPGSGDCGVFMLMFISYVMLGRLPKFTSSDGSFLRKRIAVDIFLGDIVV